MAISKEYMITELKKRNYTHCNVQGGRAKLEEAPERNVFAFYMAVCKTGRAKKAVTTTEKQLEFSF